MICLFSCLKFVFVLFNFITIIIIVFIFVYSVYSNIAFAFENYLALWSTSVVFKCVI